MGLRRFVDDAARRVLRLALVEAWLAGEGGPAALAQVLLGETNPSGKLPFTFPRRIEDCAARFACAHTGDALRVRLLLTPTLT
jgi:hypothetical protein